MAEKRMRGKRLIECISCGGVTRYQNSHAAQIDKMPFYTELGQRVEPPVVAGRICKDCVEKLGYHRKTRKTL